MEEMLVEMIEEMKEYISDADGTTEFGAGFKRGAAEMISIMKSYFTGIEGSDEAFNFDPDTLAMN